MKDYETALSLVSSVNDERNQSLIIPETVLKELNDVLEKEDKREELQRLKVIMLECVGVCLYCYYIYLQDITELLEKNGKIAPKFHRKYLQLYYELDNCIKQVSDKSEFSQTSESLLNDVAS